MAAAIIVAAGRGRRMPGRLVKQYRDLHGQPVLAHTLKVFEACDPVAGIVLVVPETDLDFCRARILRPLALTKPVKLAPGGAERQDSVYSGILCAAGMLSAPEDLVAIHDGVRPLVTVQQVTACIRQAGVSGACILGIPVIDTLKQVDPQGQIRATVPREDLWMAQTPQVFRHDLIFKAHEQARRRGYVGTDDAELVERLGITVSLIAGSRRNFKITTAEDLALARALMGAGRRPPAGA